jgi:hypothetical protein
MNRTEILEMHQAALEAEDWETAADCALALYAHTLGEQAVARLAAKRKPLTDAECVALIMAHDPFQQTSEWERKGGIPCPLDEWVDVELEFDAPPGAGRLSLVATISRARAEFNATIDAAASRTGRVGT